jgi:hypothetical protein
MLRDIGAAHRSVIEPVLRKHRQTLKKLDKLMQDGAAGRANALWRKSGLLDDLAKAIAAANGASVNVLRQGIRDVREVVRADAGE